MPIGIGPFYAPCCNDASRPEAAGHELTRKQAFIFHLRDISSSKKATPSQRPCGKTMMLLTRLLTIVVVTNLAAACSFAPSEEWVDANYDYLIGKSFSQSIYKGRQVYKKLRETESVEELESRREDGCVLVFGVRKVDDVIDYWRVDSGPNTCKFTKRTRHLNQ